MAMYAKVRRMRYRDGLPIIEIARRTSLSRNTIKTWLREPTRGEMRYQRDGGSKKIDAYVDWLRQALETDSKRSRGDRRTARRLFDQLVEQGFTGDYSRVTEFIRSWRTEAGAVTARSAYVPLSFAWGEAFQFDWSEEHLWIGGVWRKIQLAHMKLCASRAFWLVAYPGQSHEMLFDAHTRCLTGLGGVTRRGIYDNMKTAVDRVPGRGKGRTVNARFAAMTAHYLFDLIRTSATSRPAGRKAESRKACWMPGAGSGKRRVSSVSSASPSSTFGWRPNAWRPGRLPIPIIRA